MRDRRFDRTRRDIHNPAPLARNHARQNRGRQQDRGQHVGLNGGFPFLLTPVGPDTRGRTTGVIDQNVRRIDSGQNLVTAFFGSDVAGDRGDIHTIGITDIFRSFIQRPFGTRIEHKINTGFGQFDRAATPKPLG